MRRLSDWWMDGWIDGWHGKGGGDGLDVECLSLPWPFSIIRAWFFSSVSFSSCTWSYFQFSFESIEGWDDSASVSWPGTSWSWMFYERTNKEKHCLKWSEAKPFSIQREGEGEAPPTWSHSQYGRAIYSAASAELGAGQDGCRHADVTTNCQAIFFFPLFLFFLFSSSHFQKLIQVTGLKTWKRT